MKYEKPKNVTLGIVNQYNTSACERARKNEDFVIRSPALVEMMMEVDKGTPLRFEVQRKDMWPP